MLASLSKLAPVLKGLPPLSVYVHLPWCIKKCPYCDFNSHQRPDSFESQSQAYLQALEAQCDALLPHVWGRAVHSVFIGGGTPSLFSAEQISQLIQMLRARFRLLPTCEVTLEANPGTFEVERFKGFAKAGVNRLSIGVQSFNDQSLLALGRVHSAEQAKQAIALARDNFESFNIDLMYALPGQSLADLSLDLETALRFLPPHLSYYQLTLEPNTYFAKFPPRLPDDDLSAQMQDRIEEQLGAQGLEHYEVSAYAKAGHRCDHNLNYWRFGDYVALGAGGHGKLSFHDRIVRYQNWRKPEIFVQSVLESNKVAPAGESAAQLALGELAQVLGVEMSRTLKNEDRIFEFFLNTLRLVDGVESALFEDLTGLNLSTIQAPIKAAMQRGLLDDDPRLLKATPLGLRFLSDLQANFLLEPK